MKNIFIILLLFILLSYSLKNSGYGNSIILQTNNYEYTNMHSDKTVDKFIIPKITDDK